MYKRLLISSLLLAILFPTASSWAKAPKSRRGGNLLSKMSFGPQVGGSLSRIIMPTDSDLKEVSFEKKGSYTSGNIMWFTAGVTGEFYFLPQLGVGIELLYGRTGAYSLTVLQKIKQESIIAPVVVTYCTEQQGNGIRLSVGLQPSLALTTSYYELTGGKDEKLSEEEKGEDDIDTEDKFRSFDLALVGGIAYRFTNGLEIGMRMSQGLLERRTDEAKHASTDAEKVTWRSISNQLYVGYNVAQFFK